MYVLLEFLQKIMAIPIMNPLSWFMMITFAWPKIQIFFDFTRTIFEVSPYYSDSEGPLGGPSLAKSVDEISKFGNLLTKFLISAEFL